MPANSDPEISLIADSFDKVLERFDAFVAREQAFTEDASHELRTPLSIVISSAQLLAQDPGLSTKSRTRLRRLQLAAAHMHELSEALLYLAREDGGGSEQSCIISEVVQNAVDVYNAAPSGRQSSVSLKIHSERRVQAPYGLVLSVVNNLLHNAAEHGGDGPVSIELHRNRLVIKDAGPGVDPTVASHIFEHRTHRPESRGQGLGLFVVKRICDRLGWRIKVHSKPNEGACFELVF